MARSARLLWPASPSPVRAATWPTFIIDLVGATSDTLNITGLLDLSGILTPLVSTARPTALDLPSGDFGSSQRDLQYGAYICAVISTSMARPRFSFRPSPRCRSRARGSRERWRCSRSDIRNGGGLRGKQLSRRARRRPAAAGYLFLVPGYWGGMAGDVPALQLPCRCPGALTRRRRRCCGVRCPQRIGEKDTSAGTADSTSAQISKPIGGHPPQAAVSPVGQATLNLR